MNSNYANVSRCQLTSSNFALQPQDASFKKTSRYRDVASCSMPSGHEASQHEQIPFPTAPQISLCQEVELHFVANFGLMSLHWRYKCTTSTDPLTQSFPQHRMHHTSKGSGKAVSFSATCSPAEPYKKIDGTILTSKNNDSRLTSQPTKMLREMDTPVMRLRKSMWKKQPLLSIAPSSHLRQLLYGAPIVVAHRA